MDHFDECKFTFELPKETFSFSAQWLFRRLRSDSLAVNVSIIGDVLHERDSHDVNELEPPVVLNGHSYTVYPSQGWRHQANFDVRERSEDLSAASVPSEHDATADHETRSVTESAYFPDHASLSFTNLNYHERTVKESRTFPQDNSSSPLSGMGWNAEAHASEGRRTDQHCCRRHEVAQDNYVFTHNVRPGERLQDPSDRAESISLSSSITSSSIDHHLSSQKQPETLYSPPMFPSDMKLRGSATTLRQQATQLSDDNTQYLKVKREVDRVRNVNQSVPRSLMDDEKLLHAKYIQALKHYEEALERNVATLRGSLKRRATPQLKSELQELKAALETVRRRHKHEDIRRLVNAVGWIATS